MLNKDAATRKRTIFAGQEIEVWWEVKNLHFREWGETITLRCLNDSDLIIAPIKIDKRCQPLATEVIRVKFKLPMEVQKVKETLRMHMSLFDETEGLYFGDDFTILLEF